jgi:tRNA A-37 threonylcarbamoyl transferase component Bud32
VEGKLIVRTNKAELLRLPDGSVLKRYFTKNAVDRVIHDQRSLLYMLEHFGEVYYNGWLYSTAKLLWVSTDDRSLCLEFVPGCELAELPKSRMKEAEYHCGVWMALFHNKVLNGNTEGLIHTDFCVHNIMLDFDQKRVTAIDPGMTWGRSGFAYEDLWIHIYSVLVTLVVRRKAPFSAIISCLKGYALVREAKLDLALYYQSLFRDLRRQFLKYITNANYLKCLSFVLLVGFFFPFYLFFIPGYLFLKQHPTNLVVERT